MLKVGRKLGSKNTRHFMREWRVYRGLNQAQVAERVVASGLADNFDRSRVSKLERGVENLTEPMIYLISEALQIEPGWLWARPDIIMRERAVISALGDATPEQASAIVSTIEAFKKTG